MTTFTAPFQLSWLPAGINAFGDDEWGVWCELSVAGTERSAPAVQRFRWIEPGSFRIGSRKDDPQGFDDERPKHEVTIPRGYWLADTTCTQALWRAVVGNEPSGFKGDQRPVEEVSWNDVQEFLAKLEANHLGCGAGLPTEAEWEYACRAGTTTQFSFGDDVTLDQVNFGDHATGPDRSAEGHRRETVDVKSLPANPWGLSEMHGNVWEWCADGKRSYQPASVKDPVGEAEGDAFRVVRGGSWIDGARRARSAFRIASRPGDRVRYLGFRFCLRSVKPAS
ncbi:MAG: formylglycine-generating enzyme family protein [Phycisphaerae bacterium]|nr:formylglycine-generating enzyme family protein [Phycisphaerae bacterium]